MLAHGVLRWVGSAWCHCRGGTRGPQPGQLPVPAPGGTLGSLSRRQEHTQGRGGKSWALLLQLPARGPCHRRQHPGEQCQSAVTAGRTAGGHHAWLQTHRNASGTTLGCVVGAAPSPGRSTGTQQGDAALLGTARPHRCMVPPSHPLRATGHMSPVLRVGTAGCQPRCAPQCPWGTELCQHHVPRLSPLPKCPLRCPGWGNAILPPRPATPRQSPSEAELGTPLGARCHFASPGPRGRKEPAARGSQSQVTKVSLPAGWGWGCALTCPMHPWVAVGRGWQRVALGDSSGGGRGQRNSDKVRTQQQSFGALPRDTATLLGTQPSSWGHCHLPRSIATFLGTPPLS